MSSTPIVPVTIIPAPPGWAALTPVPDATPADFAAEPILSWAVPNDGGPPIPVTVKGRADPDVAIYRPDDSVCAGGVDFPSFADYLKHVRGDAWEAEEDAGEVRLDKAGNPIPPVLAP